MVKIGKTRAGDNNTPEMIGYIGIKGTDKMVELMNDTLKKVLNNWKADRIQPIYI